MQIYILKTCQRCMWGVDDYTDVKVFSTKEKAVAEVIKELRIQSPEDFDDFEGEYQTEDGDVFEIIESTVR